MRTEEHQKVEAVLFAVGRDISVDDITHLCSLTRERALEILKELKDEYSSSQESALSLQEKGSFWKFSVKDKHLPLVTSLVENTELDRSTMETLAVIAWKYPILQADVIKIRHNKAYDHMKMLEERGFIMKERSGRTYKIKLTPKFFEYFDLPSQDAKEAFRKVIPKEIQDEIVKSEQEIEIKEKEIAEQEVKAAEQKNKPTEKEKDLDTEAQEAIAALDKELEEDFSEVQESTAPETEEEKPIENRPTEKQDN